MPEASIRDRVDRLVPVLRRQSEDPETMASFFATTSARDVVAAVALVAFGPLTAGIDRADVPDLLRDGLHAAARWPEFDAEAFGASLAELLSDPLERDTVAAVTSFLLASGRYDARLLAGWSARLDQLDLPPDRPLTWGSFLTGTDTQRAWSPLAAVAAAHLGDPAPSR